MHGGGDNRETCAGRGRVGGKKGREEKLPFLSSPLPLFHLPLSSRRSDVGDRKWCALTRLETRTKESNRRAREKIVLPVLLSY